MTTLNLTMFDDQLNVTNLYNFDTISSAVTTAEELNPEGYYITVTYYDRDIDDDVTQIVWENNVDDVVFVKGDVIPFTPRFK